MKFSTVVKILIAAAGFYYVILPVVEFLARV